MAGERAGWPFGDLLRWSAERLRDRVGGRGPEPARGVSAGAAGVRVAAATDRWPLRATWVGHSTVLLQLGDLNVLVDPVLGRAGISILMGGSEARRPAAIPFASLPPVDVVRRLARPLRSSRCETIRDWRRHIPRRDGSRRSASALAVRFGVRQAVELDWWSPAESRRRDRSVHARAALQRPGLGDRDSTLWGGFVIQASGWRVFFAGDTGYHPEFARIARSLGPFDLALMPIGAYEPRWFMRPVHMDPEEAVTATVDLSSAHPGRPGWQCCPSTGERFG